MHTLSLSLAHVHYVMYRFDVPFKVLTHQVGSGLVSTHSTINTKYSKKEGCITCCQAISILLFIILFSDPVAPPRRRRPPPAVPQNPPSPAPRPQSGNGQKLQRTNSENERRPPPPKPVKIAPPPPYSKKPTS